MKPSEKFQKYIHHRNAMLACNDGDYYNCPEIDSLLTELTEILEPDEGQSLVDAAHENTRIMYAEAKKYLDCNDLLAAKDAEIERLRKQYEEIRNAIWKLEAENAAWEEQLCLQSGRIVQLEAENARLKSEHYLPKSFIENFGKETI
jgi:uncharacterized protein YhaN